MTLLNALDQSGYQTALAGLALASAGGRYSDEQLRLSLIFLTSYGVLRMAHINDQPVEAWGVPLGSRRRPDGDTLDQYLNQLIQLDEAHQTPAGGEVSLGQVRPGGLIETAQLNSLVAWAEAGLLGDEVWLFDGHVLEYTGQADLGQTQHGTKEKRVKAIKRFTLYNRISAFSVYFPSQVTYAEAMRYMLLQANAVLPRPHRIRKLAFDREGWDGALLQWLAHEQQIVPITWVKATAPNQRLLAEVPSAEFVAVQTEITVGKSAQPHRVVRLADTRLTFPELGQHRVVVLETQSGRRLGIYTTAPHPKETRLDDQATMTTLGLLNAMRFKQRIENGFKVEKHEMQSDALPSQKVYERVQTEPYPVEPAERHLSQAQKRCDKYTAQVAHYHQLLEQGQLNRHEFKLLQGRTERLQQQAQRQIEQLETELASVMVTDQGQTVRLDTDQVLDVRKLTLLNLFKTHALVALFILAEQLGWAGAGPARLRRAFLPFGDRVEFDHDRHIVTVYAQSFPRAGTQQAYERLCSLLNDLPVRLERHGISYQVFFSW